MALFSTGGNNNNPSDLPLNVAGRPKAAVHPTFSSGAPVQSKKPILETRSGSSISPPPKPFVKSNVSTNSAPEVREPPNAKALASIFSSRQEDGKPLVKQNLFKPKPPEPSFSQDAEEPRSALSKPPLHMPSLSLTETRPVFPKPPPASIPKPPPASLPKPLPGGVAKPPWMREESGGGPPSPIHPKLTPLQKPSSSIAKLRQQSEDGGRAVPDCAARPVNGSAPKPPNFRTAQAMFTKNGQSDDSGGREGAKPPLTSSSSTPPVPPASKKPSIMRRGPAPQTMGRANDDPASTPKKNPLPNIWALGSAPAKPNRPPRVNLENFKRGSDTSTDGAVVKKSNVPPPPSSHPTNHMSPPPPPPAHPAAPSLPPRPILLPDQDENYDDIGASRTEQDSNSDGDMYVDLEEHRDAAESKQQEKRNEKMDKKRQDVGKKEQKERQRKEQEARRKFKLSGPIQVIHMVKAKVDCKGGRTDLTLKQGDTIDIIRVLDNPEGRWLGRTKEGAYGYVKTDSVEIDFDSLKRQGGLNPQQEEHEPDVYDDVGFNSGPGVVLPPPPEEDGDIYDDLDDPSFNTSSRVDPKVVSKPSALLRMFKGLDDWRRSSSTNIQVPPPPQFQPEVNSADVVDQSEADQEIYDDIDPQGLPPPPPLSSHPLRSKGRSEEMDPKKQRKLEKEEKEFRKKFKFDGEIQVLYQVTIVSSLSSKKWGSKDLQLIPGETLDVISSVGDNRLICRNNEGKFGYVQSCNIFVEDADIYDDIGDGGD